MTPAPRRESYLTPTNPGVSLSLVSTSPATRRTGSPVSRRYSWLTLAAAVVGAAALLTGDIWATRAGAIVAFLGGFISSLLAWREVKAQRRAFDAREAMELHAQGEKLHAERTQHMKLLTVLQARNSDLRGRLLDARSESARLEQEVSSLRGDNVSLRLEVARLTEEQTADLLGLPRRAAGPVHAQEEVLWTEENYPTVVDLKAVTAPFSDDALLRRA